MNPEDANGPGASRATAADTNAAEAPPRKPADSDQSTAPEPARHPLESEIAVHSRSLQPALPGMGEAAVSDEEVDLRWSASAEATLRALMASGRPFNADHVREVAGMPTRPNRVGMLFLHAARRGEIEPVGVAKSTSRSRRHGMITLWRGAA